MQTQARRLVIFVLFLIVPFRPTAYGGDDEILVFVAASLTDAMNEIKERFEERAGG
ncbi:MAG TPA: molybdate ABC transporter substrate-binding protein, partial [Planctomycetia bacterium]|nr:molybdate ABC transporter substrate-binding protein [Planctomycetia bacterium]